MEEPVRGEVVVVHFPFSSLTDRKKRPAMVLASLPGNDVILCQITSQPIRDRWAVPVSQEDFVRGSLRLLSNVRPNKLFTFEKAEIIYSCGHVTEAKFTQVIDMLWSILKASHDVS